MTHRNPARIGLVLFLACLCLAVPRWAQAEDDPTAPAAEAKGAERKAAPRRPLLWMIEGPTRIYLYGTIHVDDPRVVTHLPVVAKALDQSTALYAELQLDAAGQQQMQTVVMARAQLPAGKTLKGILGDELYARVEKALPPTLPLAVFGTMKPWLINFLLQQTLLEQHAEYRKRKAAEAGDSTSKAPSGAPAQPLDMKLYIEAQAAGKKVGGLETIDTQLDVFDRLKFTTQAKMTEKTLEEIERVRALNADDEEEEIPALTHMIEMWLAGDDAGFLKLFQEELREQAAADGEDAEMLEEAKTLMKGLLDDRNVGMVAKIQELAKQDPKQVYFIAVGAGHMPGEQGMVKLLERAGHEVRRIELGATLPPLKQPAVAEKVPAGAGAGR